MFRTEIYRILSRKMVVAAMTAAFLLVMYYGLGNTVWREGVIDEGKVYDKTEAIARDKEITAEFSGVLTEDTVRAIWDKYGAPADEAKRGTYDVMEQRAVQGTKENYCNRFVARTFAELIQGEGGDAVYVLPEDLSQSPYLQGEYYFGYAGNGWDGYWDMYLVAYVLACIVIVVALAPMFAEDYACGAADIILPTVKGRGRLWLVRTSIGCCFASLYYGLLCGGLLLEQLYFYGTEGLQVSCKIAYMPMFFPENAAPLGRGLVMLYLAGWFAVLVLVGVVQCVSAKSKQSFGALVWSVLIYIGPFAVMRVVLDAMPMEMVNALGMVNVILHYICYSTPFSYPGSFMQAPGNARLLLTGIAAAAALAGALLGSYSYCHHQVETTR